MRADGASRQNPTLRRKPAGRLGSAQLLKENGMNLIGFFRRMPPCVVYCVVLATAGTCDWQLQRDVDGKSFLHGIEQVGSPKCCLASGSNRGTFSVGGEVR